MAELIDQQQLQPETPVEPAPAVAAKPRRNYGLLITAGVFVVLLWMGIFTFLVVILWSDSNVLEAEGQTSGPEEKEARVVTPLPNSLDNVISANNIDTTTGNSVGDSDEEDEVDEDAEPTPLPRPPLNFARYVNDEAQFFLYYPDDWQIAESEDGIAWIYAPDAEDPQEPVPYPYGRVTIDIIDATSFNVEAWFDARFAPNEIDEEQAPQKLNLLINGRGIPVMETLVEEDQQLYIRYYTVINGNVITFTLNYSENDAESLELQEIFGSIISSVADLNGRRR